MLESSIDHFYHGELSRRQYRARLEWLSQPGFDPAADLSGDLQQPWAWKDSESDRSEWFRDYFAQRNEDGLPVR